MGRLCCEIACISSNVTNPATWHTRKAVAVGQPMRRTGAASPTNLSRLPANLKTRPEAKNPKPQILNPSPKP